MAERVSRRGLMIVIGDFLDDAKQILEGLNHLHYARHEVLVLQVLDPCELTFPFEGRIRFDGLEGLPAVPCQPRLLRQSYLESLHRHIRAIKVACERNQVDYCLVDTSQPLEIALTRFLQSRALRGRQPVR